MTWLETDVEQAKKQYLAQFSHNGCGGAPEAYVGPARSEIGCTGCKQRWPGDGPLGKAVARIREFTTMVR